MQATGDRASGLAARLAAVASSGLVSKVFAGGVGASQKVLACPGIVVIGGAIGLAVYVAKLQNDHKRQHHQAARATMNVMAPTQWPRAPASSSEAEQSDAPRLRLFASQLSLRFEEAVDSHPGDIQQQFINWPEGTREGLCNNLAQRLASNLPHLGELFNGRPESGKLVAAQAQETLKSVIERKLKAWLVDGEPVFKLKLRREIECSALAATLHRQLECVLMHLPTVDVSSLARDAVKE